LRGGQVQSSPERTLGEQAPPSQGLVAERFSISEEEEEKEEDRNMHVLLKIAGGKERGGEGAVDISEKIGD